MNLVKIQIIAAQNVIQTRQRTNVQFSGFRCVSISCIDHRQWRTHSLETGDLPFLMFDSPLSICLVFHPIGIIHLCESKFCKGNIVYRIMQSAKLFKVLHHAEQKYYMIVHFANCHTLHSFALCIVSCTILHFALFFNWSSASMDGFSVLWKLHKYDLTK